VSSIASLQLGLSKFFGIKEKNKETKSLFLELGLRYIYVQSRKTMGLFNKQYQVAECFD
jgi:hypothetical protein